MPADFSNSSQTILRCVTCGAAVRADQGACRYCGSRVVLPPVHPATEPPAPAPAPPPEPAFIPPDALCRGCGYPLTGLNISDKCPECSRPILDSIRGDALMYCDPSYLKSLHRGIVLIESSVLVLILIILIIGSLHALTGGGVAIEVLSGILGLIPSVMSLVGWYMLSTPDPGVSLQDKGDKPRKIVRFIAILNACVAVFSGIVGVVSPHAATAGNPQLNQLGFSNILNGMNGVAQLISFIAFIVQFFASMRYLTWLAPRIPDYRLHASMKKRTWIIALLFFPGMFLACIPALVSVVMYYLLLDKFRVHFKRIRMQVTGTDVLWDDVLPAALISRPSKSQ